MFQRKRLSEPLRTTKAKTIQLDLTNPETVELLKELQALKMLQASKKREDFDSLSSILSSEQRGTRGESLRNGNEGELYEESQKDEEKEARKDGESAGDDLY